MAVTCRTPIALSVAVLCVTPWSLLPEAKFLNPPPVLFQVAGAVANAASVPIDEAVAPVLTVIPAGKPVPIPLKFWMYGDVARLINPITDPDNETEFDAVPEVNEIVPFAAPVDGDDLILTYTVVLFTVPLL